MKLPLGADAEYYRNARAMNSRKPVNGANTDVNEHLLLKLGYAGHHNSVSLTEFDALSTVRLNLARLEPISDEKLGQSDRKKLPGFGDPYKHSSKASCEWIKVLVFGLTVGYTYSTSTLKLTFHITIHLLPTTFQL